MQMSDSEDDHFVRLDNVTVREPRETAAGRRRADATLGQRLVEIERLEFPAPIGGQAVLRLLGPKLIEVWISRVKALEDSLDQLSPLNRWKQACLLGQLLDELVHKRQNIGQERRFEHCHALRRLVPNAG
jgi:hypothetical protein